MGKGEVDDISDENVEESNEDKEMIDQKWKLFADLWDWVETDIVYKTNVLKGWTQKERSDGEMIALIHSEVSEALEALRWGNDKCEKKELREITGAEEELADTLIRIMDIAHKHGWNIVKALQLKTDYNKKRPFRHGGKLF